MDSTLAVRANTRHVQGQMAIQLLMMDSQLNHLGPETSERYAVWQEDVLVKLVVSFAKPKTTKHTNNLIRLAMQQADQL
jgi:hypothetical protein